MDNIQVFFQSKLVNNPDARGEVDGGNSAAV